MLKIKANDRAITLMYMYGEAYVLDPGCINNTSLCILMWV